VLIEVPRPRAEDRPASRTPSRATVSAIAPRIVRCACESCGAHINAVWTFRVAGSCPTCGSFRLAPIDGAEPMDGPRLVA
jgi:Zn finger protein HypA/HybF involved in hydrogenase expression